jgi:hypothetical protein
VSEEKRMQDDRTLPPQRVAGLLKALCLAILALMLVTTLYTAWIVLANYNQIGV